MESLFSTSLHLPQGDVPYDVIFENEAYVFRPQGGGEEAPTFRFRRAHDEWQELAPTPLPITRQATEALERYLLQQH